VARRRRLVALGTAVLVGSSLAACGPHPVQRARAQPKRPVHHWVAPRAATAPAAVLAAAPGFVPVAVVMDNAPAARPQTGLDRASVVWELLAEGGITRFLCIFTGPAGTVGPVRSTRIYFDQLDRAYGLPFAHAGGNVDALADVAAWHLQDLDEIYDAGPYFWRSPSRPVPDNLYTSTDLLEEAIRARGYRGGPVPVPPEGPLPAGAVPTEAVRIAYADAPPVYVYEPGWTWQGGAWVRTVNGQVAAAADGQPVRAGTVLILVVPYAPDPDPYTPGSIRMLWDHPGPAWVLRDGRRIAASWRLGSDGIPEVLLGGRPVPVGPPPYWYEVVPQASDVSFQG